MKEVMFMNATIWDIISALSSAVGAISIPITIYISMRPYRKMVSLHPEIYTVSFNEKNDIAQIDLKVINRGEKKITYQSWGISNRKKNHLFELERSTTALDADQCQSHYLPQSLFEDALKDIKSKCFCFYIIDNQNNKYFSKKYRKSEFLRNENLKIFFS